MSKDEDKIKIKINPVVKVNIVGNKRTPVPEDIDVSHTLVLPTRNLVLFPGVTLPIQLGRESSVSVAQFSKTSGAPIVIVCQKDSENDTPTIDDLYDTGVLARVIDIIDLPGGVKTAIIEGLERVNLLGQSNQPTLPGVIAAEIERAPEPKSSFARGEKKALVEKIKELASEIIKETFDGPDGMALNPDMFDKIDDLVNAIATHLPFEASEKIILLESATIRDRAIELLSMLMNTKERMGVVQEIMAKAKQRIENNQRGMFLQQQMEVIREELGDTADDELDALERKAAAIAWPDDIQRHFDREMVKIRRYNPQSPDYSVLYSYLDTLVSLPWDTMSAQTDDFRLAEGILEADHYGLRKVKDRVLEQLAQIIHYPEGHAPILCFVGPPGVGKTSLGRSIAAALGREFQRVSLGGLHDEAEIRGHRRTYIGAMPGRIIDAMKRAGTVNPVIMLDELDKIGADFKGDPAAALLEVLDPEQNYHFHDNYIDVDYDLSHVIFIATANTLSTISKPLLDRIEVIELSGYAVEEKIEIARRHIIPRICEKMNIATDVLPIGDDAIDAIIEKYTAESGVRQLEKQLEAVMRKMLLAKMRRRKFPKVVGASDVEGILGKPPYNHERYEGNEHAGVVTGLAWTQVGGEILTAEASLAPGKGGAISVTGNLGDVMKESATIAMQWVKANAAKIGIDSELLAKNDIHVHFPEGAVPKDGPSAGITIATAIVSALKGMRVRSHIAMTGEITLRGRVLPIGGVKEKILAAKRAGITDIVLPEPNRRDVDEIERKFLKGLKFHYVENVADVLAFAITDEPGI